MSACLYKYYRCGCDNCTERETKQRCGCENCFKVKKTHTTADVAALVDIAAIAQSKCTKLQAEKEQLESKCTQLQEDMEHTNYAYHEEQGQHRALQQEHEELQQQHQELLAATQRRRGWIVQQGNRINELEAEVERLQGVQAQEKKLFTLHQGQMRKLNSKMRREAVQLKKSLRKRL